MKEPSLEELGFFLLLKNAKYHILNPKMQEKALDLVLAVYRVTKTFPEGEVLIGQMRGTANSILAEIILNRKKEAGKQIKIILAYIDIARNQGWVNNINFDVLEKEYKNLLIKNGSKKKKRSVSEKINDLNKRQYKILNYIKSKEDVKMGELVEFLGGASPRTVSRDIRIMADKKLLIREGRGRGSIYKINKTK